MLKGIRYATTSVMILIQSELFHWLGHDDYNISAPQAVPTQSTDFFKHLFLMNRTRKEVSNFWDFLLKLFL